VRTTLSAPRWADYRDTYRDRVDELIEVERRGDEVVVGAGRAVDLARALREADSHTLTM
jgi:hypothetical protein